MSTHGADEMDAWLERVRDALAQAAGVAPDSLDLDDEATHTLLDVARIAAHESRQRTNAPLLCYLIGRAQGSVDLEELAAIVRTTRPTEGHQADRSQTP